jgi:hypothetical protein
MAEQRPEIDIDELLRRVADPRGGQWIEKERVEMRHATDEQFERAFRDPTRWSYVVRSPRGDLVAWGKSRSREECLRIGNELAEEWTAEQVEFDDNDRMSFPRYLAGHWRFVLWPPKDKSELNVLNEGAGNAKEDL